MLKLSYSNWMQVVSNCTSHAAVCVVFYSSINIECTFPSKIEEDVRSSYYYLTSSLNVSRKAIRFSANECCLCVSRFEFVVFSCYRNRWPEAITPPGVITTIRTAMLSMWISSPCFLGSFTHDWCLQFPFMENVDNTSFFLFFFFSIS